MNRKLTLDLHANEFVARYTNRHGNIIEKRFKINDSETIYNVTQYWRNIDQSEKSHKEELQKHEMDDNHLKTVQD